MPGAISISRSTAKIWYSRSSEPSGPRRLAVELRALVGGRSEKFQRAGTSVGLNDVGRDAADRAHRMVRACGIAGAMSRGREPL